LSCNGYFENTVHFFGQSCRCVALPALMAPREVYASSVVPPATDDSRTNSCRRERARAGSRVIGQGNKGHANHRYSMSMCDTESRISTIEQQILDQPIFYLLARH
jgi:hypothetical protein